MAEIIAFRLTRAALVLARTLDYSSAAESLGLSENDLRGQIRELEAILCVHLFDPTVETPCLTNEGRFLIRSFQRIECNREGEAG